MVLNIYGESIHATRKKASKGGLSLPHGDNDAQDKANQEKRQENGH